MCQILYIMRKFVSSGFLGNKSGFKLTLFAVPTDIHVCYIMFNSFKFSPIYTSIEKKKYEKDQATVNMHISKA